MNNEPSSSVGSGNSGNSSTTYSTGSGFNSVGSGSNSINDSSRLTKEKTAGRFFSNGMHNHGGAIGNMINRGGSSLYEASAKRLSRDGVKRTKMGMQPRTSNFVRVSRVEHKVRDIGREVRDSWSSTPRKTSKEDV